MSMTIKVSEQACGASITGIDLTQELSDKEINMIRNLWLKHHVISFPDQILNDDDLEKFTLYFGKFGDDPFIAAIL